MAAEVAPLNVDPFGQITSRELKPELDESAVFKAVLYYCVLVLGGPLVAFFATKALILGPLLNWGADEVKTNVVSAISAGLPVVINYRIITLKMSFPHISVVVLHLALGLFIMKATKL